MPTAPNIIILPTKFVFLYIPSNATTTCAAITAGMSMQLVSRLDESDA